MEKLEKVIKALSRTKRKNYENYVVNALYNKINNPELEIVSQQYVRRQNNRYALLDLYLSQLNIAIEVYEEYHENEKVIPLDQERMEEILKAVKNIKPIIITTKNKSLNQLNDELSEIANNINKMIQDLNKPLKWKSYAEILNDVKNKGKIEINDTFKTNVEVINLFGKSYKGWQRGGIDISSNLHLWFPILAVDAGIRITSKWKNVLSENWEIITEEPSDKSILKSFNEQSYLELNSKKVRAVFAKMKDSMDNNVIRFIGVYKIQSYDKKTGIRTYNLIKKSINLDLEKTIN